MSRVVLLDCLLDRLPVRPHAGSSGRATATPDGRLLLLERGFADGARPASRTRRALLPGHRA